MYLPVEILDQVANNLVEKRDIAAAALVNWEWYSSFTPALYRHVEVNEVRVEGDNGPDLRQMTGLRQISVLNRNPYLSSLVHSITHKIYVSASITIGQKEVQMWKASLRNIRLQLQAIIDRNGFPRVTELRLYDPDIQIAGMLLSRLYPQLELLHLATPHFRYLPFGWLAGLPSKLRKLKLKVLDESIHDPEQGLQTTRNAWTAMGLRSSGAGSVILVDMNACLASSMSLRILRITEVEFPDTLLKGVTLPHLHTLEAVAPFFSISNLPAACLASFLDRHQSISRLAVRGLSDEGGNISSISRASSGVREFISSIDGVSDNYFTFLKKFTRIKTFKLEYGFTGGIVQFPLTDLLEVVRILHRDQLGVKELVLPMPPSLDGWPELADLEIQPARDLLSGFGIAFKEYLPEVEVFGILEVGKFRELEAAEWAQALAGHPRLRKLAIKAPFLSNSRIGSKTRQEVIDEIAQEFSALPRLEQLVFSEGRYRDAVQVLIVRDELGVSGKAAIMNRDIVDGVFFDSFFEDTWRNTDWS